MEGDGKKPVMRGCIKTTTGPWVVRRRGRDGQVITSLRRPSQRERENNRQREQHRRKVRARICLGLRKHGNYSLPKHPDQTDVLKALCEEADWHVEEDGTTYRKNFMNNPPSGSREISDVMLNVQYLPPQGFQVIKSSSIHNMIDVDYLAAKSSKEKMEDKSDEDKLELTLGLPSWAM